MNMSLKFKSIFLIVSTGLILAGSTTVIAGDVCVIPDNGSGTATLPPIGCKYTTPSEPFKIINGLPGGTTIELEGTLKDFVCCDGPSSCSLCTLSLASGQCETTGGTLGGSGHCFAASLALDVIGTGTLTGFSRSLSVPVFVEIHTAPRTPGDPVQSFSNRIYNLTGELFGDPDFCTFRIRGGSYYAYDPNNNGQTTLRKLPSGDFAVDSFFDIAYQIEFEGCPDSTQLSEYSGTTTQNTRMETGFAACEPTGDATACVPSVCPDINQKCHPVCINIDPDTEQITVTECDCRDPNGYHLDLDNADTIMPCIQPDNGNDTVTLPPTGCEYITPSEPFKIINGLPGGTTIEMEGTLKDLICCDGPSSCSLCTLSLASGECETTGGTLGGSGHCFTASLALDVAGTGTLAGFSRSLSVPVFMEIHTAPRTPGDPVQSFSNRIYNLTGELFGDPDFCTFRIRGGSYYAYDPNNNGQTTLIKLPSGDFGVYSFFDIAYQIEFEGCPDSTQLSGYSGTTTQNTRMETGKSQPFCIGDCEPGMACEEIITTDCDGLIDVCCSQEVPDADLNKDGVVDFKDFAILARQWLTSK